MKLVNFEIKNALKNSYYFSTFLSFFRAVKAELEKRATRGARGEWGDLYSQRQMGERRAANKNLSPESASSA